MWVEHRLAMPQELINVEPVQCLPYCYQVELDSVWCRGQTVLLDYFNIHSRSFFQLVGILLCYFDHFAARIRAYDFACECLCEGEQNLPRAGTNIHIALLVLEFEQALSEQSGRIPWPEQFVVETLRYKAEQIFLAHIIKYRYVQA